VIDLRRVSWVSLGLYWGINLVFPFHLFQSYQWSLFGSRAPFYYWILTPWVLFIALFFIADCLLRKSDFVEKSNAYFIWSMVLLSMIPGIILGMSFGWSFRGFVSFMIRGFIPGFLIFWSSKGLTDVNSLVKVFFGLIVLLGSLGLLEVLYGETFILSHLYEKFAVSFPENVSYSAFHPYYRPDITVTGYGFSFSELPMGTIGNRLVFLSFVVPFIPFGIWGAWHHPQKGIYFVSLLLLVIFVLFSRVRTAWICTAFSSILYMIICKGKSKKRTTHFILGATVLIGIICLLSPRVREGLYSRFQSLRITEKNIAARLAAYGLVLHDLSSSKSDVNPSSPHSAENQRNAS